MTIEIYMIAHKGNSPCFEFTTCCRDCAIQELKSGKWVEFDKWASKFPQDYAGVTCEICENEIHPIDSFEFIEGVEY